MQHNKENLSVQEIMTRDVENDNSNTDWQTFWKLKQMSLVAS
ncbi:hypothetical protein T11_13426 [Trichinella zimbabwensis]|uniref:Uncharacterized protein n=1 Tax=Trichinella zimbabwensis TaxID=268475 RepID=A0A0V1H0P7_9BILA|nr:hypothetical protein T11_13426 [Trichinella zimbabwensis]